jgi:hypothetical protein
MELSAEIPLAEGIPAGNSKFLCVLHDLWVFLRSPKATIPCITRVVCHVSLGSVDRQSAGIVSGSSLRRLFAVNA